MNTKLNIEYSIQAMMVLAILIAVNIIAQYIYGDIDMTEDGRYTISEPTKDMLQDIDDVIYIEVLLEGKFPAGIKRVQEATRETLRSFNNQSGGYIEYDFKDPTDGDRQEVSKYQAALAEQGISPIRLVLPDENQYAEKLIYPYAILHYADRDQVVNLLEADQPGVPREEILNNSASLLEYKFASAIERILQTERKDIVITEGFGEASRTLTTDFEVELRKKYNTARINLDSITQINPKIELLYMIRPTAEISEKAKFVLDQFIMNGGKAVFILDRLDVDMRQIPSIPEYIPEQLSLNLDDLLFKYGARLKPNLLLDLESSTIPIVVGQQGDHPKIEPRPWFYHPKIASRIEHPITNGLGRVSMKFASTIDTIQTKTDIKKTVLLSSSDYSRTQTYPMRLGFELMKLRRDPTKFKVSDLPVGVLFEGVFPSLYQNRVSERMNDGLRKLGRTFVSQSSVTKICIISDGDFVSNTIDPKTREPVDFSFNSFDRLRYANKDFILNLTEYMLDDSNILVSRSKKIQLRLLDTEKARNKMKWRIINIGLPLLILLIFGLAYRWVRKRRYT